MPIATGEVQTPLPPGLADSDLFHGWGGDSLKLYLWLRARARRGPATTAEPDAEQRGFLEADATGADIEQAIGVSKNTVTKLARELQSLGVASVRGDRLGYHFRLGEWFTRKAVDADLDLLAEVFYLEALLQDRPASSSRPTAAASAARAAGEVDVGGTPGS